MIAGPLDDRVPPESDLSIDHKEAQSTIKVAGDATETGAPSTAIAQS